MREVIGQYIGAGALAIPLTCCTFGDVPKETWPKSGSVRFELWWQPCFRRWHQTLFVNATLMSSHPTLANQASPFVWAPSLAGSWQVRARYRRLQPRQWRPRVRGPWTVLHKTLARTLEPSGHSSGVVSVMS